MVQMENKYYQEGEDTFYERDGERWFFYFFGEKGIKTGFLDTLEITESFEELNNYQFRKEIGLRLKYFTRKVAQ